MRKALRLVCLLLLGALFLVSSLGKFARPKAFLGSVLSYRLLPGWLNYAAAATFPGIELVTSLALLAGLAAGLAGRPARDAGRGALDTLADAAAWLAAGMLLVFMAGMSIDILRGIKLDCGCFDLVGSYIPFLKSSKVGWGTVFRDLIMLLLVVPIVLPSGSHPEIDTGPRRA